MFCTDIKYNLIIVKREANHWLEQAQEHYDDALYLFDGSRYSASLYFAHQALEKILKACVVEFKNRVPPKIHQLDKLAKDAGVQLPKGWGVDLAEITRHFWRVRYPDFRRFVYKSKEDVEPTIEKTKEVFTWILNKLSQK